MPELPEVETTRRGLAPWLEGARLQGVSVHNAALRWPVPTSELEALIGNRMLSVRRRGKYLLLDFAKSSVLLHLGMSGSMRVLQTHEARRKHDHLEFFIEPVNREVRVVRFNDPRRFGCCLVVTDPASHPLLARLGPEPLSEEFHGEHLFRLSRKRKLAVKNFIMDGRIVVGVGNIYASEALHRAALRPGKAASRISRSNYQKLALTIREVLDEAIIAGGTTLNDFTQSDGQPGYFSQQLQVYGRAGQACYRCGGLIKCKTLGQRSTYYCMDCQQ